MSSATANSEATGAEEPKPVKRSPHELRSRALQLELWLSRHGRGPRLGMLGFFVGRTSAES